MITWFSVVVANVLLVNIRCCFVVSSDVWRASPDRDQYIDIQADNILPGRLQNFAKKSTLEINSLGQPYDLQSIMHYKQVITLQLHGTVSYRPSNTAAVYYRLFSLRVCCTLSSDKCTTRILTLATRLQFIALIELCVWKSHLNRITVALNSTSAVVS